MKAKILAVWPLLFLSLFSGPVLLGQRPAGGHPFWGRVQYGGGVGLGFTNGGFNMFVSPSALYRFNDQLAAGTSLNFNYAKFNDDTLLAYGGSLLTLYNPLPPVQLSIELEQLRVNRKFDDGIVILEDRYWVPALFLGIGYSNGQVTVGIRYDILFDDNRSIYVDAWMPFIRVFF